MPDVHLARLLEQANPLRLYRPPLLVPRQPGIRLADVGCSGRIQSCQGVEADRCSTVPGAVQQGIRKAIQNLFPVRFQPIQLVPDNIQRARRLFLPAVEGVHLGSGGLNLPLGSGNENINVPPGRFGHRSQSFGKTVRRPRGLVQPVSQRCPGSCEAFLEAGRWTQRRGDLADPRCLSQGLTAQWLQRIVERACSPRPVRLQNPPDRVSRAKAFGLLAGFQYPGKAHL